MPHLILCADDYGYSTGVSRAILTLIERGRISATSVMAGLPGWPGHAPPLRALGAVADIGLHVTLTQVEPLGKMPHLAPGGRLPTINRLTWLAYRGALRGREVAAEIAAEIDRQFDRFLQHMGRLPDHVDGHQHCHVLPTIRPLFLEAVARRAPCASVRNCADSPLRILRRGGDRARAIGSAFLGCGLQRDARRRGLESNDSFAGFYDFAPDADMDRLFRQFLSEAAERHLIMCHPAMDMGDAVPDRIAAARHREFRFLMDDPAGDLIAESGLTLGRFPRSPSAAPDQAFSSASIAT